MAEPKAVHGARAANKRGVARLVAVQALYQMDVGRVTLPRVVAEFENFRLTEGVEGDALRPADKAFFRTLVAGVVSQQREIDPRIHETLPASWPLSRIDVTLRAILRCGVFELGHRPDIPARVVINEYVDVARAFFEGDEPRLVNGVLDRLAKDLRAAEFAA